MAQNNRAAPPIVILSFNRPDMLAQVLRSLKEQSGPVEEGRVHLFQDGQRSRFAQGDGLVEPGPEPECVTVFRAALPGGHVHLAPHNLGIALNFDRAERHVFETLGAEVAYFFEDDMVLSPHYLTALDMMADYALNEERVGYVAAYGYHKADLAEQSRRRREVVQMHHHWGFALTRRQWLRQREIVLGYLKLVAGVEYGKRPSQEIRRYFEELGFPHPATSQDAAKEIANNVLGTVRVMCFPVYGHYIGKEGTHFTQAIYERAGFGTTAVYPDPPDGFDFPSAARLSEIADKARRAHRAAFVSLSQNAKVPEPATPVRSPQDFPLSRADFLHAAYAGLLKRAPDPTGLRAYESALRTGTKTAAEIIDALSRSREFQQRRPAGGASQIAQPQSQPQTAASVPLNPAILETPRMSPAELSLLKRVFSAGAGRYLEFGMGGSTLAAVRAGFGSIVAVDSDPRWVSGVASHPEVAHAISAGRVRLLHGDIGPVGPWGMPAGEQDRARWPAYTQAGWAAATKPDLVFVDGRFRVACCLSVALACPDPVSAPRVLMHDMGEVRPHYAPVLEVFDIAERAETLFLLTLKAGLSQARVLNTFLGHQFDPR